MNPDRLGARIQWANDHVDQIPDVHATGKLAVLMLAMHGRELTDTELAKLCRVKRAETVRLHINTAVTAGMVITVDPHTFVLNTALMAATS